MEQWKDIDGYEGIYAVSNLGRVKSLDRIVVYIDGRQHTYKEKILVQAISKVNGAYYVHLYKNQSRKNMIVHRLVAKAFILNPENKAEVNHIDGNRSNNTVENLEWSTKIENMHHAFRTGLINNTGTNHGVNVYSDEKILHVKELLQEGKLTQKQIAEVTGVKKGTVEQVAQGKTWKHL